MNRDDWKIVKLGEVVDILDSKRKPVTKKDRISGEYPYYGATGIQDYVDNYIFDGKYLLVGEDGAKWGKNEKSAFIVEGKCWVNNHAHILKTKNNAIEEYLCYYLCWEDLQKYITGAVIPKLTQEALKKLPLPLPPLETQSRIASELDILNSIVSKKREQIKELDALAQSLFYDTFGDPVLNEKGWEVKKLGEIATTSIGLTYKPEQVVEEGGTIVLRSSNIQDNAIDLNDIVRVDATIKDKLYVKEGNILMCSRNGSLKLVGKTAMIPKLDEPMTFGAFMTIIRSEHSVYLRYYFLSPDFRYQLKTAQTATINQITVKMLNEIILPLPPLPLQKSFAEKIERIERQKDAIKKSIKETQTLIDEAMQRYFG